MFSLAQGCLYIHLHKDLSYRSLFLQGKRRHFSIQVVFSRAIPSDKEKNLSVRAYLRECSLMGLMGSLSSQCIQSR